MPSLPHHFLLTKARSSTPSYPPFEVNDIAYNDGTISGGQNWSTIWIDGKLLKAWSIGEFLNGEGWNGNWKLGYEPLKSWADGTPSGGSGWTSNWVLL